MIADIGGSEGQAHGGRHHAYCKESLLVIELVGLIQVEREMAADEATIHAYHAANLRPALKMKELIERVRSEVHAERGDQ